MVARLVGSEAKEALRCSFGAYYVLAKTFGSKATALRFTFWALVGCKTDSSKAKALRCMY